MARAGAAVVLAFAVCGLLVATAPARPPFDLPRQLPDSVDCEAAAEKLLPKPVQVAAEAEASGQDTAIAAVPEEEEDTAISVHEEEEGRPQQRSSLLCLVFRCGGEPARADRVALARGSSTQVRQALDGGTPPAVAGTVHGEEQGACDSDSDWDSDCDSDDEDEGGIVGWFWRLAGGF